MKTLGCGIFLLLLLACGESPAPPKTAARGAPPEMKGPPPSMEAKPPAPAPAAEEEKPAAPKKPAESGEKKEPVDKKGRSKSPELFKKYMAFMEANGELFESITTDVEEKKGDAVIKPKVAMLIKNAEGARALHYRKNPDEDKELDDDFELFLFKVRSVETATWDADSSKPLLERIQRQCIVCHDKFQ
jgi:hypothetical protein